MEDYWKESPKQFVKRIKVFEVEEKRKFEEADTLNFYLGKYVGFAVNDPKKYPRVPFTHEEKEQTAEDMQAMARSITNKIKAQNNGDNPRNPTS